MEMGTGKMLVSLVMLFILLEVGGLGVTDEAVWFGIVVILASYICRPDTLYVNQVSEDEEETENGEAH